MIVPYLRGYGTTHFLSSETFRNGQQSAVAVDIVKLMDALKIEKASPDSIGELGRPISWRPFGRNAAKRLSP